MHNYRTVPIKKKTIGQFLFFFRMLLPDRMPPPPASRMLAPQRRAFGHRPAPSHLFFSLSQIRIAVCPSTGFHAGNRHP